MRIKKSTIIDVGIFVTAGCILALTAVFFIGREKSLFEARYTLVAPFKDISGLRNGAVVQLAGLNVGYVSGVRFPKGNESDRLEVILKVAKGNRDHIRRDSVASIHTQGLLGDKYIFITTGSPSFDELKEGDTIQTQDVATLQNLTETGRKTMLEIQSAAKEVTEALQSVRLDEVDRERVKKVVANLELTSENVKEISTKIRNGEGTVGALVMDPSLYNDLRALLGHADRNKLLKNLIRATIEDQEKATAMPVRK